MASFLIGTGGRDTADKTSAAPGQPQTCCWHRIGRRCRGLRVYLPATGTAATEYPAGTRLLAIVQIQVFLGHDTLGRGNGGVQEGNSPDRAAAANWSYPSRPGFEGWGPRYPADVCAGPIM